MPVGPCHEDGKPGWRWGERGKCYTYSPGDETASNEAKRKAHVQGYAIGQEMNAQKEQEYRDTIRSLTLKLQERNAIIQEIRVEPFRRPDAHMHDPDHPRPVLVFDFNGTITPWRGFPIEGEGADPFPGVAKWINRWKAMGACVHLATAGLWPQVKSDPLSFTARVMQLQDFLNCYGIPVDYILPKADADIFYDDRMIPVPKRTADVDWDAIGEFAEQQMAKRFTIVNGLWTRKPKNRIGHEIQDDEWPNYDDVPPDNPRGYSTPIIDVDYHRTLSNASSSLRTSGWRPGAVESVNAIFAEGFTVLLSCAGWNPAWHTLDDSLRRVASLRQQAKTAGVLFDQLVTKDHGDLYFDDKGFRHTDWATDLPQLQLILRERARWGFHPAAADGASELDQLRIANVRAGQNENRTS